MSKPYKVFIECHDVKCEKHSQQRNVHSHEMICTENGCAKVMDLCDTCIHNGEAPTCWPDGKDNMEFGVGVGNDNIIKCSNYEKKFRYERG